MHITLSRHWLFVPLAILLLVVGGMLTARLAPTSPPLIDPAVKADEPATTEDIARQIATAFGQGRLYQFPDDYPLTDALKATIARLPNRAQTWPEFAGLVGDAISVLHGQDGRQQSFTDVVVHVLNRSGHQAPQLTQVDVRLIQDGHDWQVDRILTLAKGAFQP